MRYNVSYADIPEESAITNVQMLTTDISPAIGKSIEYDIPSFEFIKPENRKSNDPDDPDYYVQRLERVGAFRDMFKVSYTCYYVRIAKDMLLYLFGHYSLSPAPHIFSSTQFT